MSQIIEGCAIPLVVNGRPDKPAYRRHAISDADVEEAMREMGVEQLSDARLVALEPSGKATVLKNHYGRPPVQPTGNQALQCLFS